MKLRPSTSILGIVIAIIIIGASIVTTTENHLMYFNGLGFMLVVGGTLSAAILTYSLAEAKRFARCFLSVFVKPKYSFLASIAEIITIATKARSDRTYLQRVLPTINNPFTKHAVQLVVDGLPGDEVRSILRQMVIEEYEREMSDAAMFRVISRFPPAFGLMGTLIGLIAMMQGMGGGNLLQDLGPHMSVALLATLYGIIFANMFLIPVAESVEKSASKNSKLREILASGVLMIHDGVPVVLVKERLKAYLSEREREWLAEEFAPGGSQVGGSAPAQGPRMVAGGGR